MLQTIIAKNIISFTHFPEAHERVQYIVKETEKAKIRMEKYAHKTTTTARRTALIPILKANTEAVRQARRHEGEDI